MKNTEPYEAPTIELVGTLENVTKADKFPFSDQIPYKANSAFGPPS